MELVIGVVGGAVASFLITHAYYVRSTKSQKEVFEKLSEDLRTIILGDRRESLSVKELNELIRKHTYDPEADERFPYRACPKCGSQELYMDVDTVVDGEMDDGIPVLTATHFDKIVCDTCGWSKSVLDDLPRV